MSEPTTGRGTVPLPPAVRAHLADPCLAPLWNKLRSRLESNGLDIGGTISVDLDDEGTARLAGLLGKHPSRLARPTRLRVGDLDAALRRSIAAAGVVAVTENLTGALIDKKAARAHRARTRAGYCAQLADTLAAAGLLAQPWAPRYLEHIRSSGLLTRAGDGARLAITHTGAVLTLLAPALTDPAPSPACSSAGTATRGASTVSPVPDRTGESASVVEARYELAQLATACTGDAHGLDPGRLATVLVLRAAAAALDTHPPETAEQVRELWMRLGVSPDEVSGTVMVWALRPPGQDAWSQMMRARADLGLVTHLSLHELRTAAAHQQWAPTQETVSVCENPQVLQAAARAACPRPLICTSGYPATAGWTLLRGLLAQGVRLRYHGDFDWPGMSIAAHMIAAGVAPWRLGAEDYHHAVNLAVSSATAADAVVLTGAAVATPWDPALAESMLDTGTVVHEEALIDLLLADLT